MAGNPLTPRNLASIDRLLHVPRVAAWEAAYGHDLTVDALRRAQAEIRERIRGGETLAAGSETEVLDRAHDILSIAVIPSLRPVINATGVILHTNLGRAPLSDAVLAAMRRAGEGYSNLEFDLDPGERGSRYVHAEALLCRLTGAEAALVVNNNAGAVLLALSALARGREVLISRGELVEIGGGFRIPEVMAASGARLVEVGTTNRTYVHDYATAITVETVALMRVHASNFRVRGFVAQPGLEELALLAHEHGLLLFDDLGSGTLVDTAPFGLAHEPTVRESLAAGADLVMFSGDKLLGGPQAGILVGKGSLIAGMRRFPLTRALRVDKTTLAGVQANLLHYLKGDALREIPIWRMIGRSRAEVALRSQSLLLALERLGPACELVEGRSMIGGGALPDESLPTMLILMPRGSADDRARALRTGEPPVVARLVDDRVAIDLRTVLPREEESLILRLRAVWREDAAGLTSARSI